MLTFFLQFGNEIEKLKAYHKGTTMMEQLSAIDAQIDNIEARITAIEARFSEPAQMNFPQILSTYERSSIPLAPPPPDTEIQLPSSIQGLFGNLPFQDIVNDAAAQYSVDPALLQAVIHQESVGNPNARIGVGAMGLMQLMPDTARSLGVSDPYDARQNIFGGARYLRGLLDQFGGNISLALAAYNAGPNAVKQSGWRIPPYSETQNYVRNILDLYRQYREKSNGSPGVK